MLAELIRNLEIDNTLWIQFAAFIVFFLWMRFMFFDPFLALIKKRESLTSGLTAEAEQLRADSQKKEEEYSLKLLEIKKTAGAEKEKILNGYRGKAGVLVDSARKSAKEKIEEGRKQTDEEANSSMRGLQAQVQEMAQALVQKLTKEKVKF